MTSKELLYIEDALGHEKYFQSECREAFEKLNDPELKSCVREMEEKHRRIFQSLYGLL